MGAKLTVRKEEMIRELNGARDFDLRRRRPEFTQMIEEPLAKGRRELDLRFRGKMAVEKFSVMMQRQLRRGLARKFFRLFFALFGRGGEPPISSAQDGEHDQKQDDDLSARAPIFEQHGGRLRDRRRSRR